METAQLLFRTRTAKNDEELLDKVQSYLAAAGTSIVVARL